MLRKHLLATLIYYDCLDYPLTAFEVWKHLLVLDEGALSEPVSLASVMTTLRSLVADGSVIACGGWYALPGREKLFRERVREEKISVQKLKRARRLVRFLQWVPFVRLIGITGSLAMKKSEPESDWDFFVVLQEGRIWLGRTWLTLVLQLLGKRRHGRFVRNRACLNYYLTEAGLEISLKDAFAAHEYRFMLPLHDQGVFSRFELANRWIRRWKPNYLPTEIPPLWTLSESPGTRRVQSFLERLSDIRWLEWWLARWQQAKIARNPKTHWQGSFIETTERALIFLPRPRGPIIFERFKERLAEMHAA